MILRKKIILVSKMILKIWAFSKDLERSENKNHQYDFGGFSLFQRPYYPNYDE